MSLDALGESPLILLAGWTAVSALTVGVAASALVALVRGILPNLASASGYRLVLSLYALSLAIAVAIAATPRSPLAHPIVQPGRSVAGTLAALSPVAAPPKPAAETAPTFVNRDIVIGFVGVISSALAIVLIIRLVAELLVVRRLKMAATPVTDASVEAMIDSLANRLAIRRRVVISESPEVNTAVTGGWLQPFILLPTGLAEMLGAELEPVLAHELAHIRRLDFPLAAIQAIGDAATTLSPGHRWLSRQAGILREHACDDEVVRLGIAPLRYAQALETLGQWSRGVRVTAVVCAAGRHLASRVQRLLDHAESRTSRFASASAALALCLAAAATTVVASAAPGLSLLLNLGERSADGSGQVAGIQSAAAKAKAPVAYDPEAPGPFRITAVDIDRPDGYITVTARSVFPKRIVALGIVAEVTAPRADPPRPAMLVRSDLQKIDIEPGSSAEVRVRMADETFHQKGNQARFYPWFAQFEDGTEWTGGVPQQAALTIPRALVSKSAPVPASPGSNIPVCFDAEGKQTSEGGAATVREDSSQWVRCTNGRWVPMKSPIPAASAIR